MSVTTEQVAKIAALARIKVSDQELAAMVPELNGILAWAIEGCLESIDGRSSRRPWMD